MANTAGGAVVPVTAVIASGPAGATLSNATATTLASGAATFSGLAISGTAASYTLRFESGTLTAATSGTITLGAGTATQLTITTQPSPTATSGAALGQQPVLQVRDGAGHPAGGAGVRVPAVIAPGPAGATLSNATATTVTFSISATAAGASQMTAAGGDGQTGTVGTTLPTPLAVRVADQFNNPVAGVPVTWTPASGSGSANPPTSTSNASGIASTAWTLGTAAGTQTVQATGAGSPVTFSATATAGAATQLTITTQPPATAASGAAFTPQPVLQVRDGSGNPAGGAGVPVTAVIASGPAGATLTEETAAQLEARAATFNGLAITGAAGDYTLRFESGRLTPATSGTVTLGAGAAAPLANKTGANLAGPGATRLGPPPAVPAR